MPPVITISGLETGVRDHRAQEVIIFEPGFTTDDYTIFSAQIETALSTNEQSFTISVNPIPPLATFIPLTITYYDGYGWTSAAYSTADNAKLDAGNNLHAVALPTQNDQGAIGVKGMVTGTRVRTLLNPTNLSLGQWLTSQVYYDRYGRVLQTRSQNIKGGADVTTSLYDFSGKLLCNYVVHTNNEIAEANRQQTRVNTQYEYDHSGVLLKVYKIINDDNPNKKLVAENEYDELGRLIEKKLGKLANNEAVETQEYDYNIRGWMKGINTGYARDGTGGKKFGMELNYDWGFDHPQYNGNISGTRWRSMGDDEVQLAYGFGYDKANRIMFADFKQLDGSQWNNDAGINFTSIMGDGLDHTTAYDANGNILAMKQWGLKVNTSSVIDELVYSYAHNGASNRLQNVIDIANNAGTKLGDFRTGANSPNAAIKVAFVPGTDNPYQITDYIYDTNGNMVQDLNKDIAGFGSDGITYNHLNLPYRILVKKDTATLKGSIKYIYDANGVKLKKITTENDVTVTHHGVPYQTNITTTTDYLGGFVYESKIYSDTTLSDLSYGSQLQFFEHEEGRVRPVDENNQTHFVYDYFLKDHLGNVRMVLSEEEKESDYLATMEIAQNDFETALFEQVSQSRDDKPNGFDQLSANEKVSKLSGNVGTDRRIGPGKILKVMAGDMFTAKVFGWYQPGSTDHTTDPGLASILTSLLNTLSGTIGGMGKATPTEISGSGALNAPLNQLLQNQPTPGAGVPKAYLNYVLLDESQLKYVTCGATAIPEITGVMERQLLEINNGGEVEITKNGYLYVYVSNESKGSVYFDDLMIEHFKKSLLEETHYYPFGLVMSGISSKTLSFGGVENKHLFLGNELQSKEFADGSGLELYDMNARQYDQQIGRFTGIDMLSEMFYGWSPFNYSYNNPIRFSDKTGLSADDWVMKKNADGSRNPVWDDKVTDQAKATKYYGADATYLGKENQYTAADGREINLNTDKTWTDVTQYKKGIAGGEMQSGDIAQNRISELERKSLNDVAGVVLHRTESSTTKSTLNAFKAGRDGVNYGTHFLVGKDGEILQTANLGKYTLHVGKTRSSSYPNNLNSIGIEAVGRYDYTNKVWEALTPQQITAVTNLTNYLMVTYKLSSTSLYAHDKISYKTDGEGTVVLDAIKSGLIKK